MCGFCWLAMLIGAWIGAGVTIFVLGLAHVAGVDKQEKKSKKNN
jgi:uncharacterized membrane protein YedE/YeeE